MSYKHRSKSQPRAEHSSDDADVYIIDEDLKEKEKKRSSSQKRGKKSKNHLDHRPPWNNDTKIEGYDDVDENGKYRNRNRPYLGGDLRKKKEKEQAELNNQWSHSLRDKFHDE